MDLESGYFYHIFNRGNNSQRIFFTRENYLFFLKKIREHITPFASVIAWCLMPNHFHIVVFLHRIKIEKQIYRHPNLSRETIREGGLPTQNSDDHSITKEQTFNQSFGIMLSSYTRAIQKQEKITGSLFQKRTKAKSLIDEIQIEPAYWNTTFGTEINISDGKSYLETCIEYVHQNPVYSGLTVKAEDWEFSSFLDYYGQREGTLLDYEMIKKENLVIKNSHHPNSSRETTNVCIIGIGSNINAETNIEKMLEILQKRVFVIKISPMIKTTPIGIADQPDYTNGAAKIETELDQQKLNSMLKSIEDELGRDRTGPKFGPRTMDLDIVVWNGEIVDPDYYTRDFLEKSVKAVW